MNSARNTLAHTIVSSSSTKDIRGNSLRRVKIALTRLNRVVELISYNGNAVEVYTFDSTGLANYEGTLAQAFPGGAGVVDTMAKAWFTKQKSQAAGRAFAVSMATT